MSWCFILHENTGITSSNNSRLLLVCVHTCKDHVKILYVYVLTCRKHISSPLRFRALCDSAIREMNEDKFFNETESDSDVSM